MAQARECPKCGGAMTQGYIVDHKHGGAAVASWVEGEPRKSFWVGLKLGGTTPIEIATWRCRRCFYLENYATGG